MHGPAGVPHWRPGPNFSPTARPPIQYGATARPPGMETLPMAPHRFRPRLDGLEDRLTPAANPFQVVIAAQNAEAIAGTLRYMSAHLAEAHTAKENQFIATYSTDLTQAARFDAAVLSEYRRELQADVNANPQLSGTLSSFIARVGVAEATAQAGAVLARAVAIGFGTPVSVVDPPPPAPPGPPSPPPPITGLNPTDASGMTDTFPNPNDPNFRDLGDGVKVWDVAIGKGDPVQPGGTISAFYTGWLASNGTQFETNRTSGTPLRSPLSGLIQGWQEGIPGMMPGGIRRLFIPAAKAYGSAGSPPKIPPNSDLVFEIKLLTPGT